MTVQDLINTIATAGNSEQIINYYVALLIASLIGLFFVNTSNFKSPINYLYSVLVYLIAIPGILAVILLVYNFFYLKSNLLRLEVVTYYLPIIAMFILFIIISKTIPLKRIPGFNKITGLFMVIFIAFIFTYLIQKVFIGIFFIGSMTQLLVIFVVMLLVLKLGWDKIFR